MATGAAAHWNSIGNTPFEETPDGNVPHVYAVGAGGQYPPPTQVEGLSPEGADASDRNPVLVAGADDNVPPQLRNLHTNNDGDAYITSVDLGYYQDEPNLDPDIPASVSANVKGLLFAQRRAELLIKSLAAQANTFTQPTPDENYFYSRMVLVIQVTEGSGVGITPRIEMRPPSVAASADWVTVWEAGAPITGTGLYTYYFADGASGGAFTEVAASGGVIGGDWRVVVAHEIGDPPFTYSVSAYLWP